MTNDELGTATPESKLEADKLLPGVPWEIPSRWAAGKAACARTLAIVCRHRRVWVGAIVTACLAFGLNYVDLSVAGCYLRNPSFYAAFFCVGIGMALWGLVGGMVSCVCELPILERMAITILMCGMVAVVAGMTGVGISEALSKLFESPVCGPRWFSLL